MTPHGAVGEDEGEGAMIAPHIKTMRQTAPPSRKKHAQEVLRRLQAYYGHREWSARRGPLEELIYTVLSQNTSDANTDRTYPRLRERFPTWQAVLDADLADIADAIKLGGLSQIKAPRIQGILRAIQDKQGNLDLSFLEDMPMPEAKAWLRNLPGVGPKTAACVLLFALDMPALPVDTHVHRVARRLGLIDDNTPADKAHDELEALVAPDQVYQFHMDLIEHGRRVCKAPKPRCEACVLYDICPSSTVTPPGGDWRAAKLQQMGRTSGAEV